MRHTPLCYFARLVAVFPQLLKWAVVLFFIGGSLYGIYVGIRENGWLILVYIDEVVVICVAVFGLISLYEWATRYLKDC